ncbi:cobyrinic acid a,c-diamide synthase [Ancylomarina euxinus]|uniref:Cobyrinic acid a,c-diamide synthase n=1 Tax=Ancylomarina euxinus TaxID=2283627 RepID=A0A425Y1P1_9BACT|nr:ATP-binding protein [Ancylomarina euxinus]MCZ4695084.1 ATP-binding protein [Ancylomarina euxinus]MUP14980.1 AAA family ATPase [Ancylomarina euxinus]RRG21870.1 cobyrinic acid a,c-diamide synthase [Ancylomarina euxinus]
MSYKIAIASGKGGTGKTSISVCLQHFITKYITKEIQLIDCDVEEPNDILFYPAAKKKKSNSITQLIPEIDKNNCNFCNKCADYCEFNAISIIPSAQLAEVNASLCHSCGACLVACEQDAIKEKEVVIGQTNFYLEGNQTILVEGVLKIGSPMQTLVIKGLKKEISDSNVITLYDAPPGTSCPVVETISDTNYIILVTEPTPFGLHDLKLMIALIKEIKIPFGVIINKAGLGNNEIYDYMETEQFELLGEIPFDQDFATKYAKGDLLKDIPQKISDSFYKITNQIKKRMSLC